MATDSPSARLISSRPTGRGGGARGRSHSAGPSAETRLLWFCCVRTLLLTRPWTGESRASWVRWWRPLAPLGPDGGGVCSATFTPLVNMAAISEVTQEMEKHSGCFESPQESGLERVAAAEQARPLGSNPSHLVPGLVLLIRLSLQENEAVSSSALPVSLPPGTDCKTISTLLLGLVCDRPPQNVTCATSGWSCRHGSRLWEAAGLQPRGPPSHGWSHGDAGRPAPAKSAH